jgi:hypothetical protein
MPRQFGSIVATDFCTIFRKPVGETRLSGGLSLRGE